MCQAGSGWRQRRQVYICACGSCDGYYNIRYEHKYNGSRDTFAMMQSSLVILYTVRSFINLRNKIFIGQLLTLKCHFKITANFIRVCRSARFYDITARARALCTYILRMTEEFSFLFSSLGTSIFHGCSAAFSRLAIEMENGSLRAFAQNSIAGAIFNASPKHVLYETGDSGEKI